jgi:hypothetical protein
LTDVSEVLTASVIRAILMREAESTSKLLPEYTTQYRRRQSSADRMFLRNVGICLKVLGVTALKINRASSPP